MVWERPHATVFLAIMSDEQKQAILEEVVDNWGAESAGAETMAIGKKTDNILEEVFDRYRFPEAQ